MTFKQKNITVTLVNFTLILIFYMFRVFQMAQNDSFTAGNLFRLWGIVIVLALGVTLAATILTQLFSAALEARKTGDAPVAINDFEDERDRLIDLRGTKLTYSVSSLGVFVAMLTFVLGQPPLVMFGLLIFFGVLAQIIGDIARLLLYQRGF